MKTIAHVCGIDRLNEAELHALDVAGDRIGCNDDDLATCIAFESGGTWRTGIANYAGSGAVGLIQFMPQTARNLGTTVALLAAMTIIQQLEFVVRYFLSFRRTLDTLAKLYCAIFWSAAIDKDDDFVIGRAPSKVYTQNIGFDRAPRRGYFTRADIVRPLDLLRAEAEGKPRVEVLGTEEVAPIPPSEIFTPEEAQHFLNLVSITSTKSIRGEFEDNAASWLTDECPHTANGLCLAIA